MKAIFNLLAMMFIFMVMSPQVSASNVANADNVAIFAWDVGPPVIDNMVIVVELPAILYSATSVNIVSFAAGSGGSHFYDMITTGAPEPRMVEVCGLARDAVIGTSDSYLIHVANYKENCYPGKYFVKWNFNLF